MGEGGAPAGAAAGAADEPAFLGVVRSLTGRRWVAREADAEAIGGLARAHGLSEIVSRLLAVRNVGVDAADHFLRPTLRALLPDPSRLRAMDDAAERLATAVMRGERVVVFADYDVDGATSAALLLRFLAAVGRPGGHYVPDRIGEGYGPNGPALLRLRQQGASVVVTVDCGSTAGDALAAAATAGLDVIVVDHHQCADVLPPASAIVNPNRPDDASGLGHLAAVGVAFLLAVATNRALRTAGWYTTRREPDLRQWLDLVALGTICDMVPLTGVNRAFVRQGLLIMAGRGNTGLDALAATAGLGETISAGDLGFVIGPRINAGGRVGESDLGTRLLATDDPAAARALAARLDALNRDRQQVERGVLDEAVCQVTDGAGDRGSLIWAVGEGWHPGVVGIVASRLVDRFHKPAIVGAASEAQIVASARSVPGVDIGGVIGGAMAAGLLVKGGGHPMAGGLTVARSRADELAAWLAREVEAQRSGAARVRLLHLEAGLSLHAVATPLLESLSELAPYGSGNPEPVFGFATVQMQRATVIGADHVRCQLNDGRGGSAVAMAFRAAGSPLGAALLDLRGAAVHIAGRLRPGRNGQAPFIAIEDAALPY